MGELNESIGWFYVGFVIYTGGAIICSIMFIIHLIVTLRIHGYAHWLDSIYDHFTDKDLQMTQSVMSVEIGSNHDQSGKMESSSPVNTTLTTNKSFSNTASPRGDKKKRQRSKSITEEKHTLSYVIVQISTAVCVFLFALHGWSGFAAKLNGFSYDTRLLNCLPIVQSGSICYIIAKGAMYLIMILRLELAYAESTYAYSKITIYGLVIVIPVWVIASSIMSVLYIGAETGIIGNDNKQYHLCNAHTPLMLTGLMVLFDLFFSVVALVCFIRPLKTMRENMRRVGSDAKTTNLERLATKYTITVAVSVSTTFVGFLILYAVDSSSLLMFDVVINCVCIGLMCSVYDHYYEVVCCGLIGCCQFKDVVTKRAKTLGMNNDIVNKSLAQSDSPKLS